MNKRQKRVLVFSSSDDNSMIIIKKIKEKLVEKKIVVSLWKETKDDGSFTELFTSGTNFIDEIKNLPIRYDYYVFVINKLCAVNEDISDVYSPNIAFEQGLLYAYSEQSKIYNIMNEGVNPPVYIRGLKNKYIKFEDAVKNQNIIDGVANELAKNINSNGDEDNNIEGHGYDRAIGDLIWNMDHQDGLMVNIKKCLISGDNDDCTLKLKEYCKRVFYQKLLFAGYKIHDNAISANLWCYIKSASDHTIISREREGYFEATQLISIANDGLIDYRSKRWNSEIINCNSCRVKVKKFQSIAASVINTGKIDIVDLQKNKYNEPEQKNGVKYIIGIPLIDKNIDTNDIKNFMPISMTIDLGPSKEEWKYLNDYLRKRSKQIQGIGKRLVKDFNANK